MHTESIEEIAPIELLEQAQAGDCQSRDRLLGWAYVTAHSYYRRKVSVESALTRADAEDLASSFYLEFAKAWPRIKAVYHYTRRMLKNNLRRHLVRARSQRNREVLLSQEEMLRRFEARAVAASSLEGEWSDHDWLKYRVIGKVMERADHRTRELVQYRCADPGLPYREISLRTGTSEAALRMRMARFYQSVRHAHSAIASTNHHSA
ncbi:MAG: DNA-directed RNA polymerase specialized sigma24 family protein [Rhodothermales bacterium]|jgi:DNA-directed RNA polymerase specialized sigma24 family protein